MLQTNEDSAAEHLLGSISFDAASQWQACDTGFVNVAFPHKVMAARAQSLGLNSV